MITINEYKQQQQLIVVDIQKEYEKAFTFNISDFIKYMERLIDEGARVYYFFNGETVGGPTEYELYDYLIEYGLDESYLHDIYFFDKGYGYFRQLIDNGYHAELVKVLKYMIDNNIDDANDIDDVILNEISVDIKNIIEDDPLYYQDVIDEIKSLPSNNNILVGGGENECLAEIIAILDALNYEYIINYDFIY